MKKELHILNHKKILITGCFGFIGRTLSEFLLKEVPEIELFGIDLKKPPTDKTAKFLKGLHYTNLDIRQEMAVKKYFDKQSFNGIIHLAAVSRVVDAENNKQNCIATNYLGTKSILENIKDKNTWIIFGSSREVYGEPKQLPISENADKLPINIYGFYKLMGEELVKNYIQKYIILRFSNVYGNRYDIPNRVIPNFVQNAIKGNPIVLEGGEQVIDFTFIDDTINSIIKCMEKLESGETIREEFHILPGNENKITDIIDILKKQGFQFSVQRREKRNYDVEKFIGNPGKRISILGNQKFLTLKEGLLKLIAELSSDNQTTSVHR